MARARSLKPGFFDNTALGALLPLARLLFAGLWCHADREGRLEDDVARIRVKILPYDRCDVDKLLGLLADGEDPFIVRYAVGGKRFIQIVNFTKHQNPHVKEAASMIPPPGEPCASTVLAQDRPDSSRASSLFPLPSSLSLHPLPGEKDSLLANDSAPVIQPATQVLLGLADHDKVFEEIAQRVHEITCERVNLDRVSHLVRAKAAAGVHPWIFRRWLEAFVDQKRAKGYAVGVGLIFTAAETDLHTWLSTTEGSLVAQVAGSQAEVESKAICDRCKQAIVKFADGTLIPCACRPQTSAKPQKPGATALAIARRG